MTEVKFFPFTKKNKKENLLFLGKYQKYFISCVENISNFTRATHYALVKLLIFSTHSMKYIWYSPQNSKYPLCIEELFNRIELYYSAEKRRYQIQTLMNTGCRKGCLPVRQVDRKGGQTILQLA